MEAKRIFSVLSVLVVVALLRAAGLAESTGEASTASNREPPARLLLKTIERVSFSNMPLSRVFDYYSKISGLDIQADWSALREVGITATTPVTLKARKVRYDRLLDLTLSSIAPDQHPLAWRLSGKVIIVSTQMRILLRNRLRFISLPVVKTARRGVPKQRELPRKTTLRRVDFSDISLKEAIDFIRDASGANIHVNWRALETIGITRDTKINLKARDISIARLLTLITDQLSVGQDKYSSVYWVVEDGVVEIATGEALNRSTRVEVYDISDLLLVVPNFVGPTISLTQTANAVSNANNNYSIWGDNNTGNNASSGNIEGASIAEQRQKLKDQLIEIIKMSIGEEMWAPEGKGSVRILGNKLIISQTPLGFKLLKRAFR
ncbi:MAG: hypothetical protein J7L99_05115 [Planctomycetes bacterium]|nr:hypothetical protein [Planctomycetota bacterium]